MFLMLMNFAVGAHVEFQLVCLDFTHMVISI